MTEPATTSRPAFTVALAGNPNSGKTTLFNALTGLRQKTGNYPGVTVEHKSGTWDVNGSRFRLIDLPGCYSLIPRSPDEQVASDVVFGRDGAPRPDVTVCVVDVTNLARHLYLVGQIIETGRPVVVALTMVDEAERLGLTVDIGKLAGHLHVPVVPICAATGEGIGALGETLLKVTEAPWRPPERPYRLPPAIESRVVQSASDESATDVELLHCLAGQCAGACGDSLETTAARIRADLGIDVDAVRRFMIEARYKWQRDISTDVVRDSGRIATRMTRRLDDVLLHRVFGPPILIAVLALVFQAVFSWASYPQAAINFVTSEWLPGLVSQVVAPGLLQSLLTDGVIAGVGSVIVFLPQILLIFLLLTLLEDSGYLARAAFILDHVMSKVGLSGRSFIPLLSSFACAIPGIMATRTIPHQKDRLATILVVPLMTCSARLPVYTLLIAAFIPAQRVWGPFNFQGLTLLSLYGLGIIGAMLVASIFRRTILRGPTPPLLLELPPYRLPRLRTVLLTLWERTRAFLVTAGTIIFAVSIILWAMFSFPKSAADEQQFASQRTALVTSGANAGQLAQFDNEVAAERVHQSLAGRLGHAMEPVLKPLGFDWKMGIGILGSFAAREVFVSTMGVVYGVGSETDDHDLASQLKSDRDSRTGNLVWTPLVAVTLLVFYAFALQCASTVAVMKRETGSWKWPVFALTYMSVLAYGAAFLTRQIGLHFFGG